MNQTLKLSYIENKEERNLVYKKFVRELLSSGKYSWKRRGLSLALTSIFVFVSLGLSHSSNTLTLLLIGIWFLDAYRLGSLPFKIKKLYQKPNDESLITFELLESGFRYEVGNVIVKFEFSQIESVDKINQCVLITLKKDAQKQLQNRTFVIYSNAFKSLSCDDFLAQFKSKLMDKTSNSDIVSSQDAISLVG